jgi:hypothetical protein
MCNEQQDMAHCTRNCNHKITKKVFNFIQKLVFVKLLKAKSLQDDFTWTKGKHIYNILSKEDTVRVIVTIRFVNKYYGYVL